MTHHDNITANPSSELTTAAPVQRNAKSQAKPAPRPPLPARVERLLAIIAEAERQSR